MKITAVEAEVWRVPFAGEVRPAWSPGNVWSENRPTIFRVETDEGITGHGAGHGAPDAVRERVAPKLIGRDPFFIPALVRTIRNSGAGAASWGIACGIEIALWDLAGKAANLPLCKLWGAHTNRVKAYASLVEVRSPVRRAEDVLSLYERGYRAVKLRLHDDTIAADVAQVAAVREAVGDRMEIMVDANQAQEPGTPGSEQSIVWSFERAVTTCRELAQLDVVWLEEPLGRFDFDPLRRLTAASDVPIAGGENNVGLHEFRWLIDQDCYDVIQADAVVSGGLGLLRKVAAYAEMHQKPFVPHHGGSGLGVAAHLHLSASCPNSAYVELLQEPPNLPVERFQGLLREPLVPREDGYVYLPDKPGLGVELAAGLERIG
ncbi:MAG: mandelate racemase/muconate lactonizing enzyme family protein [Chloroflexota bacterium]|nr:mandelate racemase/muconate lactonizing enzyme family protein [Chloroflexota bacterium]